MCDEKDSAVSAQSVLKRKKAKKIIERGIAEPKPIYDSGILGERASFLKRDNGFYDIIMHGSSQTVDFFDEKIDPHTLAQIIKGRSDYHGEPVRLLSCNTGKQKDNSECFAQRLSDELKIPVKAPNDYLWVYPPKNGISEITIGTTAIDNDGEFLIYYPRFK